MINFHPDEKLLLSFVKAELPTSVSVAVSIHLEMCELCQSKVNQITAEQATSVFNLETSSVTTINSKSGGFAMMLDNIMEDESLDDVIIQEPKLLSVKEDSISLPRALQNLSLSDWSSLGKVSRTRIELEDDNIRSSILHIDQEGEVPTHTHKGFEITVMLSGSYSDSMGTYNKGDFIWLDGNHTHNPKTEEGCFCYTVVSDALHFTSGVSRLLNPIGKLIY